jgi:cytochrome c556
MTFRFVGSELQIGNVLLKTFGHPIDLDAETAKEIIAHEHSAPLLPDAAFTELGFTAEDLRWANSETFKAKRKQAWAAMDELRARLRSGGNFEKETE